MSKRITAGLFSLLMALTVFTSVSFNFTPLAHAEEGENYEDYEDYEDYSEDDDSEEDYSEDTSSDENGTEAAEAAAPKEAAINVPSISEDFFVYDEVGVISKETRETLVENCDYLASQFGAQIVCVVVKSLNGANIETYTDKVRETWMVGGQDGYGIIFVIDVDGDDYWAVASKGLKEQFTNEDLQELLDTHVEPYFAQKDYDGAVKSFVHNAAEEIEPYIQSLIDSGVRIRTNTVRLSGTKETIASENTDEETEVTEVPVEKQKRPSVIGKIIKTIFVVVLSLVIIAIVVLAIAVVHGEMVKAQRKKERAQQSRERMNRENSSRNTNRNSAPVRKPSQSRPSNQPNPNRQPQRPQRPVDESLYRRPSAGASQAPRPQRTQRAVTTEDFLAKDTELSENDIYRNFMSRYDR